MNAKGRHTLTEAKRFALLSDRVTNIVDKRKRLMVALIDVNLTTDLFLHQLICRRHAVNAWARRPSSEHEQ